MITRVPQQPIVSFSLFFLWREKWKHFSFWKVGQSKTTTQIIMDTTCPSVSSRFAYHLARKADWAKGKELGLYTGSAEDLKDGFLHFSTAKHIEQSCRLYRKGEDNLILIEVNLQELKKSDKSGEMKWDPVPSRGEPFPHLYGALELNDKIVPREWVLEMDAATGYHTFPEDLQQ